MSGPHDDLRDRLADIAEELAERAIGVLRDTLESGGSKRPAEERRLTRARSAVEKAIHLLDEPRSPDD